MEKIKQKVSTSRSKKKKSSKKLNIFEKIAKIQAIKKKRLKSKIQAGEYKIDAQCVAESMIQKKVF